MARRGSPLLAVDFHPSLCGTFMERSVRSRRGRRDPRSSPRPRAAAWPAGPCEGEVFARLSEAWRHDSLAELASEPEGMANQHVGIEARAARIDAPAAIDGDRVCFDARPFVARLIAVLEGRVAAAEICVALPQRCVRKFIRHGDRV